MRGRTMLAITTLHITTSHITRDDGKSTSERGSGRIASMPALALSRTAGGRYLRATATASATSSGGVRRPFPLSPGLSRAASSSSRPPSSSALTERVSVIVHPGGEDGPSKAGLPSRGRDNKNPRRARGPLSRHRKERGQATYKFVDRARIRAVGGAGGNGSMSNRHVGRYKKRPDGGHGGDGGAVILVADQNEQTLGMSVHHYAGEDGGHGGANQMNGRKGRNRIVRVPCGVVVRRVLDFDEVWDGEEGLARKLTMDEDGIDHHGEYQSGGSEDEDTDEDVGDSDSDSDSDLDDDGSDYVSDYGRGDDYVDDDDDSDDYDEHGDDQKHEEASFVNTGVKGPDGMYHWQPEDSASNEEDEWISSTADMYGQEREQVVIADLDKPGSFVVLTRGGRGGTGNMAYAKRQHNPEVLARAGERRVGGQTEAVHLELELKLIADLGLVGFPNAGKSSLLAAMSMAKPEIAPYPFTTLHPLVGTVRYRDGFRVVAADVPGLIGGASEGRGRGHDFLRHLERTKALLYIVDAAGVDGRDPVEDLRVLADEIGSYGDGDMLERPALLVANKTDLIQEDEEIEAILFDLAVAAEELGIEHRGDVLGISAGVTGEGLAVLSRKMRTAVEEAEVNRIISEA